jgi:hypothetical protein
MDLWTIIFIIVCLGVILAIIFLLKDILSWKHTIIIKQLLNKGKKIIKITKAKDYTDENGTNFWLIKGEKEFTTKWVSVPPSRAIEQNEKGRKTATMYKDENGAYLWAYDEIERLGDDKQVQPLLTSHRILQAQNYEKALRRGGKNFWTKHGLSIVVISVVAFILVMSLIFIPDVIDAFTGKQDRINTQNQVLLDVVQVLLEVVKELQALKYNIQTINTINIPPPN